MVQNKKITDLLESGDFTIAFHDKDYCCLYKGKFGYDNLPEKEDYSFDMDSGGIGYAPEILVYLVKALKGNIDSI